MRHDAAADRRRHEALDPPQCSSVVRGAWIWQRHEQGRCCGRRHHDRRPHHYFDSKLELYVAVHRDLQQQIYGRFVEAVRASDTFLGQIDSIRLLLRSELIVLAGAPESAQQRRNARIDASGASDGGQ